MIFHLPLPGCEGSGINLILTNENPKKEVPMAFPCSALAIDPRRRWLWV
jgi:hypothetical protein